MYSDVQMAKAADKSHLKFWLMVAHMCLAAFASRFPRMAMTLFLLILIAFITGLYALAMRLTGASFMAVLPWALCTAMALVAFHYRRGRQRMTQQAVKYKEYWRHMVDKYHDLEWHPNLPNSIRKELGIPQRNAEGQPIDDEGNVFVRATVVDL